MINVNNFQEEFGERVRVRREQVGMTQEELANKLGYKHKTSVSKIEKGITVVPSSMVIKIAQALGIPVQQLMGRDRIDNAVISARLDKEVEILISAWSKATHDEKMQIYYVLKKYGMPEPFSEDTGVSSAS